MDLFGESWFLAAALLAPLADRDRWTSQLWGRVLSLSVPWNEPILHSESADDPKDMKHGVIGELGCDAFFSHRNLGWKIAIDPDSFLEMVGALVAVGDAMGLGIPEDPNIRRGIMPPEVRAEIERRLRLQESEVLAESTFPEKTDPDWRGESQGSAGASTFAKASEDRSPSRVGPPQGG